MAVSNVIREYLVRLGFNFSTSSLNKAMADLNTAKNKATSIVTSISKNIGVSFTSISSAIVAANAAVAGFVTNIAKADLQTQTAANRMYMNADAYRSMEQAATALGYSMNNLTDIALSPELTAQFKELVQLSQQTAAPVELNDQLKQVRSVLFEFNRLKVIVQNGMRQVASQLLDILDEDLKRIKVNLNAFVNRIQDQLPKISRGIAELLVHVLRAGNMLLNVIRFVGQLSSKVFEFLNKFPGAVKVAGAALIGVFVALNPMLAASVAGIGGLMALIDDYMVYQQGGNSFFGDKWQDVEKIGARLAESLGEIFTTLYNKAGPLFSFLMTKGSGLIGFLGKGIIGLFTGANEEGRKALNGMVTKITTTVNQIAPYIKSMFGTVFENAQQLLPLLTSALGSLLKQLGVAFLDLLPSLTNLFNTFVNTVGGVLQELTVAITPLIQEIIPNLTGAIIQIVNGVFIPIIQGLGNVARTIIPIIADAASFIAKTINETIAPILTKIVDIVVPLVVDAVNIVAPYLQRAFEIIFFIINDLIGPVVMDLLDSIKYVIDIFRQMGIDFDAIMRPLFGLMGLASDGMLKKVKEIADILQPILMPLTKLAEIGESARNTGEKFGNFVQGRGFKTNEDLGIEKPQERQTTSYNTQRKYNNTPNADATNIIPDLTNTSKYYGNILDKAYRSNITKDDIEKYKLSEEINNYDNKRTTNTNNNKVTQNITINNNNTAAMTNPFGAATTMANNIIQSMMLSPVTR